MTNQRRERGSNVKVYSCVLLCGAEPWRYTVFWRLPFILYPAFGDSVYILYIIYIYIYEYRQPPSGQPRVYRVTHLLPIDGVHCAESSLAQGQRSSKQFEFRFSRTDFLWGPLFSHTHQRTPSFLPQPALSFCTKLININTVLCRVHLDGWMSSRAPTSAA